ncbi:MAG: hypothetical protein IPK13_21430 [Deltaproteobacteria bacterium]|nr:hypothetical protein [Deltaproteobacteria bacterium]
MTDRVGFDLVANYTDGMRQALGGKVSAWPTRGGDRDQSLVQVVSDILRGPGPLAARFANAGVTVGFALAERRTALTEDIHAPGGATGGGGAEAFEKVRALVSGISRVDKNISELMERFPPQFSEIARHAAVDAYAAAKNEDARVREHSPDSLRGRAQALETSFGRAGRDRDQLIYLEPQLVELLQDVGTAIGAAEANGRSVAMAEALGPVLDAMRSAPGNIFELRAERAAIEVSRTVEQHEQALLRGLGEVYPSLQ